MHILDLKMGAEGEAKVELTTGQLQVIVSENTPGLQGGIQINIPTIYFFDALKAKVTNPIIKSMITLLEGIVSSL